MKHVMSHRLIGMLLVLHLCGCVVGEVQRRIAQEDTAWIQRGQTTREQVIKQFGEPNLTMPSQDVDGLGEYAVYGQRPQVDAFTAGGLTSPFEPRPRGVGPQVHRPPVETLEATPAAPERDQRFWLLYDARGVVEDFGLGGSPVEAAGPVK